MRFTRLLVIWLNHTSTASLLGLPPAGGQRHVAFGRSGRTVRQFLQGSGVVKRVNQWQLPVESYGDIPSSIIRIYENPSHLRRPRECRLAGQSLLSPERYLLWERAVIHIRRGSRPMQAIVIFRDSGNCFRVRVLALSDLHRLPTDIGSEILRFRSGDGHLITDSGEFVDISCPDTRADVVTETGVSGSSMGSRPSRPLPRGEEDWSSLRGLLEAPENEPPERRVGVYKRILRRRGVRDLVLRCFGERCQVRGCEFTKSLPQDVRRHVLMVHHLRSLAQGGTDRPYNLSVVCANHHALCHNAPSVHIEEIGNGDDVVVLFDGGSFLIERNLSALDEA